MYIGDSAGIHTLENGFILCYVHFQSSVYFYTSDLEYELLFWYNIIHVYCTNTNNI